MVSWPRRLWPIAAGLWLCTCFPDERPLAQHLACVGDSCQCMSGYDNCDGDPRNGCEADLILDPRHCGACGARCENGQCVEGECVAAEGYVDCNEDPSDGFEAYLQSDPRHCGRCDHDCLGGRCSDGQCQPFVLSAPGTDPWLLTADDTHLYFCGEATASIMRLAQGGGAMEILAVDQPCIGRISVAGDEAYWATAVNVSSDATLVVEASISARQTSIVSSAPGVWSVRAEGDTVAWWAAAADGTDDTLLMVRTGVSATPTELYRTEDYFGALSLAGDELYFIEYDDPDEPRWLSRIPLDGGPAEIQSLLSEFGVWMLRTTESYVYWGEWLDDDEYVIEYRIMRMARSGEPAQELHRGYNRWSQNVALHADSTGVYWAEQEGERLLHVPCDSEQVIQIATYQDVQTLTTSPTAVFWADYPGKIFGLAKEASP